MNASSIQRTAYAVTLAMSVLVIGAFTAGPVSGKEPFYSWFYMFAWWPYIIGAEAWLWPRGKSLLFSKPGRFFTLIPLSAFIWLVFEAFNFRLDNWHYQIIQKNLLMRWPGYFFAFGTVLPGLWATKNVVGEVWPRQIRFTVLKADVVRYLPAVFFAGLLFLVLPVVWPRYFFPLVWGGFVLLLEPFLYLDGRACFLKDLEAGDITGVVKWLAAGLVCGVIWESMNFWAGSKWIYTVPFVGGGKIFEMPVLGFFGFPPFALECVVMVRFFDMAQGRLDALPFATRRRVRRAVRISLILFYLLVFSGIDRLTMGA